MNRKSPTLPNRSQTQAPYSNGDVYTPVSGEVVDTNQAIVDDPSKINQDPENTAWFFKLKIKDKSEIDSLMNKDEYDKFAKESSQ